MLKRKFRPFDETGLTGYAGSCQKTTFIVASEKNLHQAITIVVFVAVTGTAAGKMVACSHWRKFHQLTTFPEFFLGMYFMA